MQQTPHNQTKFQTNNRLWTAIGAFCSAPPTLLHPTLASSDLLLFLLNFPKLSNERTNEPQVNLVDGQMFRFDMDDEPGDSARVKLPHKEIIDTLREVGDTAWVKSSEMQQCHIQAWYIHTTVSLGYYHGA